MDLIIRQARLAGQARLVDLAIKDGRFAKIDQEIADRADEEIQAGGRLLSPPFVESHVHLDSALTLGQPRLNQSGSLLEGIQIWGEYKEDLTQEMIMENARETLLWLMAQGVLRVRAHIDTTEPKLLTIKALLEVREQFKDFLDLQIVAFPQDGLLNEPGMLELLEEALNLGADVVGGIPQVEITREDGIAQIEHIFKLADKYKLPIDIHTDETTDEQSRFAEVIAKFTHQHGMAGRVTASHTTALHNYNNDYAHQLIGNLHRAGVNIVTNPFSNAMLQNRLQDYPKHRGTTRVKELLAAGVNVSIGNDNIMDPFNPLGKGNLLQAAHLLAHTAHMSSPADLKTLFQMVTSYGARTLNLSNYGIREGLAADFILLNAQDEAEAIRLQSDCLLIVRKGKIIGRTRPAEHRLYLSDEASEVFFTRRKN